jgi:polysaccharide export outer membrane protein
MDKVSKGAARVATLLLFALVASYFVSCTPKDVAYFQDKKPGTTALMDTMFNITSIPFKMRPGDRISISVRSRNNTLSNQFNLYGTGSSTGGGGNYLIDDNGDIDFPVLGKMHVAGMNRQELTDSLTQFLRESRLVDDAIVRVEYTGLYITLLGQNGGRRVNIDKDKLTFFEFMAMIGDINMNAIRTNILVIREEDGVISQYELDVTKMKNVYESPAYYLHQNDIVYIEPNNKTKRSTTNLGNMFHTWGFWTSITGVGGLSLWSLIKSF